MDPPSALLRDLLVAQLPLPIGPVASRDHYGRQGNCREQEQDGCGEVCIHGKWSHRSIPILPCHGLTQGPEQPLISFLDTSVFQSDGFRVRWQLP